MSISSILKEQVKKEFPRLFIFLKYMFIPVLVPYRKLKKFILLSHASRWVRLVIACEQGKIRHAREQDKIRVAFIIIHRATWKTSGLYELLENDPHFDPYLIIAPDISRPREWSKIESEGCLSSFSNKGYEVYVASRCDSGNRKLLHKISPDVIFLNNPHGLTCDSLHKDLIEDYLACYVPYHMEVGKYNDDQDQYNRSFHNAMWRIFAPHHTSLRTYERVADRRGENVVVSGYPGIEHLFSLESFDRDPWKPLRLKRIIWAPHHTIEMPNLPYSNFLKYAELFKELVNAYCDQVQWCFKPHPLLKPKLLKHPEWGPQRTEAYFEFWENHANTQLELGEYAGLFRNSDAMIHDSGSFLAEYLYIDKPVMYLWSSLKVSNYFNEFGLEALAACERGESEADIRHFIVSLLKEKDGGRQKRRSFLEKHPMNTAGTMPSEKIILELKRALVK